MRIFVPMTPGSLFEPFPPRVNGQIVNADASTSELQEVAYEEALEDMAFTSLQMVQEANDFPARVVAVGGTDGNPYFTDWNQVQSLHVDGPENEDLISKILASADQEETDTLIGDLFESSLEWFDVSEIPHLKQRFASN